MYIIYKGEVGQRIEKALQALSLHFEPYGNGMVVVIMGIPPARAGC